MQSTPVAIGDIIGGRYRLEGLLGEGGMAVVYRARHLGTGRPCALKLVRGQLITRPDLVDMFIREAQVGSKIGPNPHIVDVIDAAADEARRVPFLVMDLLEGETLEVWRERNGPMPRALLVDLFEQLGDALGQAHRAGVVHRDLKPSNLFLTTDRGGKPLLKVLDFGIAKVLASEDHGQGSATQVGTPAYAAPEQLGAMFVPLAQRQGIQIAPMVSAATDVWAMGLIAYELLTGLSCAQYWAAETPTEVPLKAAVGPHEAASLRAGDRASLLPPGFDDWFARCLRKNSAERWPSAGHAVTELARILGAAVVSPSGRPLGTPVSGYGPTEMGMPAVQASYPPAPSYAPPPMGMPPQGGAAYGAYAPPTYGPPAYGPPGYGPPPYGGGPQLPYGLPPTMASAPANAPRPSGSRAVWIIPIVLIGGLFLLIAGASALYGVKRYMKMAYSRQCESSKSHCEEACDADDAASCAHLAYYREVGSAGFTKDLNKAAELYQKACDHDDMTSCAEVGRFHLTGRGGLTRDDAEALRLITRSCDGGSQRGCAILGEMTRDGDAGLKPDDTRAAALFKGACEGHIMSACKNLGTMTEAGRGGVVKDLPRAAALYTEACDGGNAGACNDLGVMANTGRGMAKDQPKAAGLYKQACDGGEPVACTNLASMYEYGKGGLAKDEAHALALYTKACDDGSVGGCTGLGIMYEYGKANLTKDPAKATELYRRACDAHHAYGCFALATMEERGVGVAKDEVKALAHYRAACDGGNASGCNGIGVMTEYGKGGLVKDETKAAGIYKQACDEGGVAQACTNYGILAAYGRGLPADPARAAPYFKQACDAENSGGCSNLGYLYLKGLGVAKDRGRGIDLLRRGCSGGYEWGCRELKTAGGR